MDSCGMPSGGMRRLGIGLVWAQFAALSMTLAAFFITTSTSCWGRDRVMFSTGPCRDPKNSSFLPEPTPWLYDVSDDRVVTVRRCEDVREETEWRSWPSFEDDRCIRRGGSGRVPLRARDKTEGISSQKGKTSRARLGYHMG